MSSVAQGLCERSWITSQPTQITSPRYTLKDAALGRSQLFGSFIVIDCTTVDSGAVHYSGKKRKEAIEAQCLYLFCTACLHPFLSFLLLPVLDCPALTLQSSRSLDTLSDLKLQRLEAELEGARHEAQGACQREEEMKAEVERLKDEIRQLQDDQRERVSVALVSVWYTVSGPFKQTEMYWTVKYERKKTLTIKLQILEKVFLNFKLLQIFSHYSHKRKSILLGF